LVVERFKGAALSVLIIAFLLVSLLFISAKAAWGQNIQWIGQFGTSAIDTSPPTWTQAQLQAAVTVKDAVTGVVLGFGGTTKKTSWWIEGGAREPGSTINVYVGASVPVLEGTTTASTTINNNTGLYDYSLTIELFEGAGQSAYIEEVDTASNTSGPVLLGTYTVDKTPPVIALSSPVDGTSTDAAQITVSGTIVDAVVTDPQALMVTIDCSGASVAKTVYLNADGSFQTTVPLVEGTNLINVVAADGAVTATSGNQAVTARTMTRTVTYAGILGVKAGDWVKLDYTVSGAPPGTALPQWAKVEFLSVGGTTATVRVTMHMADGTEQSDNVSADVAAGLGLVIPANSKTGDSINMSGHGAVTIAGESTRNYAGTSRTAVYASISQYGTQLTYYWDKQTGVMVETSGTSENMIFTAKVTETNIWQAEPIGWSLIAGIVVTIVVIGIVTTVYMRRR